MIYSKSIQLDTLYHHYMENQGEGGEEVKRCYKKLHQLLEDFSFQKQNDLECVVNELYAIVERIAFLDGLHTGAKLILELLQ